MIKIYDMKSAKLNCDSCGENPREYRIKLFREEGSSAKNKQICICQSCLKHLYSEMCKDV